MLPDTTPGFVQTLNFATALYNTIRWRAGVESQEVV